MSQPVLSPITSIHDLVKGQPWGYNTAVASGGPVTQWQADGLPPGITLNSSTGRISGVPTTPGVYVVKLKAGDASDVWSAPLEFPIGVESLPFEADGAIRVDVDLQTGRVFSPDHADVPIYAKAGDKILVAIGFSDKGILQEIPMLALLSMALKVWDDDAEFLPLSDGNFTKVGDYDTTRYLTTLDFDSDRRIRDALDEFENRHGTGFAGLAEIAWSWFTAQAGFDAPQRHERTSRNFTLSAFRDLDPSRRVVSPPAP